MAAPKRSDFQRENDYVFIAEEYLKGTPQAVIAGKLTVSQQQVSLDIRTIQKRWSDSALLNFNLAKQKELARLDIAEREYWEAWERSKVTLERKVTKSRIGDKGSFDQDDTHTEPRDGNPAFLDGVMKCIAQRCAILGINAAQKVEFNWRGEIERLGGNPDDVRRAVIEGIVVSTLPAGVRPVDVGGGTGSTATD